MLVDSESIYIRMCITINHVAVVHVGETYRSCISRIGCLGKVYIDMIYEEVKVWNLYHHLVNSTTIDQSIGVYSRRVEVYVAGKAREIHTINIDAHRRPRLAALRRISLGVSKEPVS